MQYSVNSIIFAIIRLVVSPWSKVSIWSWWNFLSISPIGWSSVEKTTLRLYTIHCTWIELSIHFTRSTTYQIYTIHPAIFLSTKNVFEKSRNIRHRSKIIKKPTEILNFALFFKWQYDQSKKSNEILAAVLNQLGLVTTIRTFKVNTK